MDFHTQTAFLQLAICIHYFICKPAGSTSIYSVFIFAMSAHLTIPSTPLIISPPLVFPFLLWSLVRAIKFSFHVWFVLVRDSWLLYYVVQFIRGLCVSGGDPECCITA